MITITLAIIGWATAVVLGGTTLHYRRRWHIACVCIAMDDYAELSKRHRGEYSSWQ